VESRARVKPTIIPGEDAQKYALQILDRSRAAFLAWKEKTVDERVSCLSRLKAAILDNLDQIEHVIRDTTGKPAVELLGSDLLVTVDMIHYYEKHAKKILRREKRKTPFIYLNSSSYVEYAPIGVILVIAP
jgi:acyl-CoA reductase-like NAD-dependent aldehyde dehydrogenase